MEIAITDPKPFGAQRSLPAPVAAALERSWSEAEAFAYCTALTQGHYENFPVGSVLIPRALQPAVHSLYGFMRTADDFSDENRVPGDEAERMAYLETWEAMLTDCENGRAEHPIFIALRATLRQHPLPVQWLRDLLTAFKMDVTVRRYPNEEELLRYCRYSANPVGRLILTLFGYRDEERYRLSDHICTALQLANHWQDVTIDLRKDRIYLPQQDMRRFGVTDDLLKDGVATRPFQELMAYEVGRARTKFMEGRALTERVSGRLRWELRMTWKGGVRILDKIQAASFDVFRRRPTVSAVDWAGIFIQSVLEI